MLTLDQFQAKFATDIATLKDSEKITRETLREMSRYMLQVLHYVDCDIRPFNDVLDVLTPVNRRAAVAFFKEFTGFIFDDKKNMFTSKDAKAYTECREASITFLEDPHNNLWTWATRELQVEKVAKGFDPKEVAKIVEKQLKKANKDGVGNAQEQILEAVLDAGIAPDVLINLLQKLDMVDIQEEA